MGTQPAGLNTNGAAVRLWGEQTTVNYFSVLGVPASIGRTYMPFDTRRMVFGLRSWALGSLREHGVTMKDDAIEAILGKDFELNAAGLAVWLKREAN